MFVRARTYKLLAADLADTSVLLRAEEDKARELERTVHELRRVAKEKDELALKDSARIVALEEKILELRRLGATREKFEEEIAHLERQRLECKTALELLERYKAAINDELPGMVLGIVNQVKSAQFEAVDTALIEKQEQVLRLSEIVAKGEELAMLVKKVEAVRLQLKGMEALVTAATTVTELESHADALREEVEARQEIANKLSTEEAQLRARRDELFANVLVIEHSLAEMMAQLDGEAPTPQSEIDEILAAAQPPDVNE